MKGKFQLKYLAGISKVLSILGFLFLTVTLMPSSLSAQTDTVYEDIPDMDTADLRNVMEWIESRVTILKTPYCYRESYGRGAGEIRSLCASGLEKDGALCYPKCSDGYSGKGPVCWQNCPSGYRDDGAFCAKTTTYGRGAGRIPDKKSCSDWNAAYRDDGTSCWLDTYGRGAGRIPDKKPCSAFNAAYRDDGTSCWSDSYGRGSGYAIWDENKCKSENPQGCEKWGALWYPKCKSGYHNVACCLCEPEGGAGIKITAMQRYQCRSDEELMGALCYPKCKAGYHNVGTNLCEPDGGAGIKVTAMQRYLCRTDEDLNGALCYPKCKAGFHTVGCCTCSQDCFPGSGDDIGVSCTKKSYGRTAGQVMLCPPGTIPDETGGPAGLCYPKCKTDFHGVGPVCWQNCPNGMTDCAAGCSKDALECASTTFDQVFSVVVLAANIATLGMASEVTGPLKAGEEAVSLGNKTVRVTSKVGKYFVKAVDLLQSTSKAGLATDATLIKRIINVKTGTKLAKLFTVGKVVKTAYKAYKDYSKAVAEDFVDQTSPEINKWIDDNFNPDAAKYIKESWGDVQMARMSKTNDFVIAQDVLSAVSIVDISGVTGVVSAFLKPICGKNVPFPTLSRNYQQ